MTVIGLLLLQFAVVTAANGLVYLPGKRSEVMLSGLPTLLIVVASLALTAACALYVIDHHDRRPNEETYQTGMRRLGWLALGFEWHIIVELSSPMGRMLAPTVLLAVTVQPLL